MHPNKNQGWRDSAAATRATREIAALAIGARPRVDRQTVELDGHQNSSSGEREYGAGSATLAAARCYRARRSACRLVGGEPYECERRCWSAGTKTDRQVFKGL
jgi:hypothetical protein